MTTNSPATEALATEIANTMDTSGLRRPMIGVLARAEAGERLAQARIAELEAEVQRLRTEQITDGSDERLAKFWDNAGRIADHADFCSEYDRMAEAMNGPAREREYEVELTVELTVTHTVTVSATNEDEAEESASENFTADDLDLSVTVDDWNITGTSADRM